MASETTQRISSASSQLPNAAQQALVAAQNRRPPEVEKKIPEKVQEARRPEQNTERDEARGTSKSFETPRVDYSYRGEERKSDSSRSSEQRLDVEA